MELVHCSKLVCDFLIPPLCESRAEDFLVCSFLLSLHSGRSMVVFPSSQAEVQQCLAGTVAVIFCLRCRHCCHNNKLPVCVLTLWSAGWRENQGPGPAANNHFCEAQIIVKQGDLVICDFHAKCRKIFATVRPGAALVAREMCDKEVIKKKILPVLLTAKNLLEIEPMTWLRGKQVFRVKEGERDLKKHPSNMFC